MESRCELFTSVYNIPRRPRASKISSPVIDDAEVGEFHLGRVTYQMKISNPPHHLVDTYHSKDQVRCVAGNVDKSK